MEIIKYKPCEFCIHIDLNSKDCHDTLKNDLNSKSIGRVCKYFADKDQIEFLIEEAEKRHREKGRLVICDHAKDCKSLTCGLRKEHHFEEDYNKQWFCPENRNIECKRVAFRGEPTKEEEGHEYVVVKEFNLEILSGTSIAPKYFLTIFRLWHFKDHKTDFKVGDILPEHLTVCFDELERLGFIEKVVHDPVVALGDCFKHKTDGIYQFSNSIPDQMHLVLIKKFNDESCNIGQSYEYGKSIYFDNKKLSDCVGKIFLEDFKPVKIKITEVEEG